MISGRGEIPHTGGMTAAATLRMMSGLPFTILNTATDPDRNGMLFDPLPAGDYHGNGVNAIKVTTKAAAMARTGRLHPVRHAASAGAFTCALEARRSILSVDLINITDRTNFLNPSGDQRLTNFLLLTQLSGGGQPRQAQLGLRFGF